MLNLKKRKGAMALTALAVAGSGVLAMVSPASAAPAPVPVAHVTSPAAKTVKATWTVSPDASVDNYVVTLDKDGVVPFDYQASVAAPATTLTIENVAPGCYKAVVWAEDAGTKTPTEAEESPICLVSPPQPGVPNPWLANNWLMPHSTSKALIQDVYKKWTSCSTTEPNGRIARLDEETFWNAEFQRGVQAPNINSFVVGDASPLKSVFSGKFSRLVFPPAGGFLTEGQQADRDWYAAFFDQSFKWETTFVGGYRRADVNKDGNFTTAERRAAINTSIQAGLNGVGWGRRHHLVRTLAEDAAQTEGPAFRLYRAYFDRTPDAGGFCYWANQLRNGRSLLSISEFFLQSQEFKNTYGEYEKGAPEGPKTDEAEFVALVYANVLDRDPEAAGFAFWTRQLQDGRYSPADVLIGFSESKEFQTKTAQELGVALVRIHETNKMPTPEQYVEAGDNLLGLAGIFNPIPDNGSVGSSDDAFWLSLPSETGWGSYYMYVLNSVLHFNSIP